MIRVCNLACQFGRVCRMAFERCPRSPLGGRTPGDRPTPKSGIRGYHSQMQPGSSASGERDVAASILGNRDRAVGRLFTLTSRCSSCSRLPGRPGRDQKAITGLGPVFVLPGQIQAKTSVDYAAGGLRVHCSLPLPADITLHADL